MAKAFGIIKAATNRYIVEGLQNYRPAASFSFAGRFRLIDFPVSNMSNSGIDRILVYISGNPRSLCEHLGTGSNYNINSKRGKLQVLFHEEGNNNPIYNTDVAKFMETLGIIEKVQQDYVVIAPSNMVYVCNYDELLEKHIESGADITLLYHRVESAKDNYLGCNIVSLNRQKGVLSITPNEGNLKERNVFMDTYVMKKELFIELVKKAASISSIYHFSQIVSDECANLDVRGIQHKGYFAAITSFKTYFDSCLALTDINEAASLFKPDWPIYTSTSDACPTQYFKGSSVRNSLIANGCCIEGSVENSVFGRGINIGKDAVIKNCVILSYADIGPGVHLENQVVDKWVKIRRAKEIIASPDAPGYIRRDDVL